MMFNNLGLYSPRRFLRRMRPVLHPIVPFAGQFGGNGNDIFYNGGGVGPPGPAGPAGPQGIQGEPGEISPVPITVVTETPYQIVEGDYVLAVDFGGIPGDVILPDDPVLGDVYIVKDTSGNASLAPITITSNVALIDGTGTAIINTDFGSLTFIFTGTDWSIV